MSMILQAIFGEVRKQLLIAISYRFAFFFNVIAYAILYIAAMFIIGQGQFDDAFIRQTLVGYIITYFVIETLNQMAFEIEGEAVEGTLEQMYMSAVSPIWLIVGQVIAVQIQSLATTLMMGLTLVLFFQIAPVFLQPIALVLLMITVLGVMGFGFMIAGFAIIYKQLGALVSVLFNIVLFTNGTFLPLDQMPRWMQIFAQVIPTTQGIIVTRDVLLTDSTIVDVWRDGSLILLLAHSIIYLLVGVAIYRACEIVARHDGSLGHY